MVTYNLAIRMNRNPVVMMALHRVDIYVVGVSNRISTHICIYTRAEMIGRDKSKSIMAFTLEFLFDYELWRQQTISRGLLKNSCSFSTTSFWICFFGLIWHYVVVSPGKWNTIIYLLIFLVPLCLSIDMHLQDCYFKSNHVRNKVYIILLIYYSLLTHPYCLSGHLACFTYSTSLMRDTWCDLSPLTNSSSRLLSHVQ